MWKLQDLESAVVWSEKKVIIKDEAQIASRMRGAERAGLYLGKLLFESDEKKFSFRGVNS